MRFPKQLIVAASILVCCVCNPIFAQTADSISNRYTFALSGLSVPKQVKELKFTGIHEFTCDGSDVAAIFEAPEKGFKLTIYVYKSLVGTFGPTVMLDANGKEMREDREDEIKRLNAALKLTTPSDSYLQEYFRVLKSISSQGNQLNREFRFKAVPQRKDSPIAYGAELSGEENTSDGRTTPWTWKTYLYAIPGYFVKIHCTYPSQLWMDFPDMDFIQSINWDKFCAPVKGV